MNSVIAFAALCGVLSAILLGGINAFNLYGVLVPFVPLLPILWIGLTRGVVPLAVAAIVSFLLLFLIVDGDTAVLYGATQLFTTVVFIRELMKLEVDDATGDIRWAPAGHAFIGVTLFAAIACVLILLLAPGVYETAVSAIRRDLSPEIAGMDPEVAARFKQVLGKIPHILLALELWVWSLLLYGFTALVNFGAASYGRVIRPSLALKPFYPPTYVFIILVLTGLASFFVPERGGVLCQTLSVIFLLPYFITGIGHIHSHLMKWKHRQIWIGLFYFFVLVAQWPVFFITIYGLSMHVRRFWVKSGTGPEAR